MSTQQIPSVAQIAAARSILWHQNTPEPTETPASPSETAASTAIEDGSTVSDPSAPPSTDAATQESMDGATQGDGANAQKPDHTSSSKSAAFGIDISDPEQGIAPARVPSSVALMTQAAAREFLNRAGLLLFAARPQFSGIPAPTFVEATLGVANANPSLSASETARTLLARLIADGSAVPLNLLGLPATTAEAPDFIVSAAAFPYIFTLRGDKAWKQPPSTSGPTKVSPLAANTYTLLIENGPKSAYALTGDLGKEVTEAAVLRALSELWQQLRVLPVPQAGGKPTIWEPITTRFTKQIKVGANAGQPTALSTFVSLYLGQAILATEDEIETFLSPLAPRSRVRDVLHALSGARQLETLTIEGKHHLHVAGDLPIFGSAPAPEADDVPVLSEDGSRIRKFVSKPRKLGTGPGDRPKPFRSPSDRPRSTRPAASADRRPVFNKPWDEEKKARTDHAAADQDSGKPEYQDVDLDAGSSPEPPRRPKSTGRPTFGSKPGFGRKPTFGGSRPAFQRERPSGDRPAFNRDRAPGDRPAFNRDRPSSDRPAREGAGDRFQPRDSRRDFKPHAGSGDSRPPRKFGNSPTFGSKPSFPRKPFDPERSAGDRERRPFRRDDAAGADSRPPRRNFDSDNRRTGSDDRARPAPFGKPRFSREGESGSSRPPFRKFDAPRSPRPPREGDADRRPRRSFEGDRSNSRSGDSAGPKPFGSRPFTRRDGPDSGPRSASGPRREGGFARKEGGFAPRREGGFSQREGTSPRPRDGGAGKKSFGGRPGAEGAGKPFKKPFSRSSPDAPGANTFDKFKGNAKPWGKRPPARKYKPKEGDA